MTSSCWPLKRPCFTVLNYDDFANMAMVSACFSVKYNHLIHIHVYKVNFLVLWSWCILSLLFNCCSILHNVGHATAVTSTELRHQWPHWLRRRHTQRHIHTHAPSILNVQGSCDPPKGTRRSLSSWVWPGQPGIQRVAFTQLPKPCPSSLSAHGNIFTISSLNS